jgi:serine/threonine protein kinase
VIPAPDIPGHTVIDVLGSGGFATVYRTWQAAVGRETAVKVDSRALHSERDQRRFFREVTAAGRLSGHPHVIDVYDAGTLRDGRPYMVMELCPGGSLHHELRRNGPLAPTSVCQIGVNLADALAAAHAWGILHRDLKPANILINRYGVVGIADFGLASIIAASGEQSVSRDALTPSYAPPESFREEEPSPAADIYSMAATLYALMAGRPPRFPAGGGSPGIATILALHGQQVEDIPGVPGRMMDILRECLAADPSRRLSSAATLRDELAALLGGRPGQAPSREWQVPSAPSMALTMSRSPAFPPGRSEPSWPGQSPPGSAAASGTRSRAEPLADSAGGSRTATIAGTQGATTRARSRHPALVLAAVGGAAAIAVAGVLVAAHLIAPGQLGPGNSAGNGPAGANSAGATSPGASLPPIGVFGVATTTRHCPAAAVAGAGAACVTTPECWDGVNDDSGVITARSLPCDQPHTWQTFAIAMMPTQSATFDSNIVQADPTVKALCSLKVLLASRTGAALRGPQSPWTIQVMPPDETAYNSGVRTYRCLARHDYDGLTTPQFGP